MKITKETDYALRIIDYLAKTDKKVVGASVLSDELKVPIRFLLKILRKLNMSDITKANRGVKGGYYLKKDPKEISYLQVVEAIEGDIYINDCLKDEGFCSRNMRKGECPINHNLCKIQKALIEELEKYRFD